MAAQRVRAYAARRQAPTGVTLLASDPAVLAMFEGLLPEPGQEHPARPLRCHRHAGAVHGQCRSAEPAIARSAADVERRELRAAGAPPLKTGYRGLREKLLEDSRRDQHATGKHPDVLLLEGGGVGLASRDPQSARRRQRARSARHRAHEPVPRRAASPARRKRPLLQPRARWARRKPNARIGGQRRDAAAPERLPRGVHDL